LQVLLDVGECDAGHGEVRARAVERDVEEQGAARPEGANEVVLLAERDENVFDTVLEVEVRHRLALGAHDFGIAGGGDLEVERPAALLSEDHAALGIDQRGAHETIDRVQLAQRFFDVHVILLDCSLRVIFERCARR
jgi:hypothetical protein